MAETREIKIYINGKEVENKRVIQIIEKEIEFGGIGGKKKVGF